MAAMPSAAVSRITSTGKWLVSSHSAACGAMRSLAKVSAVSWMAACSSVRAKCMGSGPLGQVNDVGSVARRCQPVDEAPVDGDEGHRSTHGKYEIEAIVRRIA